MNVVYAILPVINQKALYCFSFGELKPKRIQPPIISKPPAQREKDKINHHLLVSLK
jgi:hypothetical protein